MAWPDWVDALAKLGGASGAVAVYARGRFDRERDHASRVYSRLDDFTVSTSEGDTTWEALATVVNGYNAPLHHAVLTVLGDGWPRGRLQRRTRALIDLEPRSTRTYLMISPESDSDQAEMWGPQPAGQVSMVSPLLLEFIDSDGRRWRRWPDGKLTRYRFASRDDARGARQKAKRASPRVDEKPEL